MLRRYQLYYRGKAKGTLWYDPVFQVGQSPSFNLSLLMELHCIVQITQVTLVTAIASDMYSSE